LHKLQDGAVTVEFPETEALPEGQHPQHNPAPCLSRVQKKDAAVAAEALKTDKTAAREERKTAAMSKKTSDVQW
jgi:hypothetical protein